MRGRNLAGFIMAWEATLLDNVAAARDRETARWINIIMDALRELKGNRFCGSILSINMHITGGGVVGSAG